jgi:hypothetical protein
MKTKENAFEALKSFEIESAEHVKGGGFICTGSNSGPNGTSYDWAEIDSQGNLTGKHDCFVGDGDSPHF